MIDFACKEFSLDDIIKCSLGLTKGEYKVMRFFLANKKNKYTSNDIVKELSLDLTTVQKSLKKLHEKDVLIRIQKNMDSGGYVYCYQIKNNKEISKKIMETINTWVNKVETEITRW